MKTQFLYKTLLLFIIALVPNLQVLAQQRNIHFQDLVLVNCDKKLEIAEVSKIITKDKVKLRFFSFHGYSLCRKKEFRPVELVKYKSKDNYIHKSKLDTLFNIFRKQDRGTLYQVNAIVTSHCGIKGKGVAKIIDISSQGHANLKFHDPKMENLCGGKFRWHSIENLKLINKSS